MNKVYQGAYNFTLAWTMMLVILLLGLACDNLSPMQKQQYVHPSQAAPMDPSRIKTMKWQNSRYLWIGNEAGAARINSVDGQIEVFDDIACPQLFMTPASEEIWCSTVNYINKYDGKSWQRFDVEAYQIIEDDDGIIWAGTMEGLMRFDPSQQTWSYAIKVGRKISSDFIFSTGPGIHLSLQSSDGSLWFYSYSDTFKGITRWTETSYDTWLPVGKLMIRPMVETTNGIVWGGGDEGVVAQWDGHQWQNWQPFRLKPSITEIIESRNGDIWVLAVVDGVGRWDGKTWQIWSRDENILQNCPGVSKGQECFSVESNVEYFLANGIGKPDSDQPRLELTSIVETQDGHIWIGTSQEGVSRWNGNEWRNYTIADGLSSEAITVLTESPDGTLWAGTLDGGVNYYDSDTDQWQPFP